MSIRRYVGAVLPLFIALLAASHAPADIIVQYTFPTQTGAGVETGVGYNPTTVHPNLDLTFDMAVKDTAGTITIEISNPTPNYSTQPVLRVDADGNTGGTTSLERLGNAVANNKYFEFKIRIPTGYNLDLSSLDFVAARGGAGVPRGWGLKTSASGLAAGDAFVRWADITTVRATWTSVPVNLSGSAFQDLTGDVTFRFYVYSPGDGSTMEFDNITLNGALTPEPTTLALLGLGALGLLRRRG